MSESKILKYPKQLWILAFGMMINVTGTSLLWPLTTIYVTEVLGGTVTLAGFVLMLQAGVGMFGSLLGGTLYDRIGGRKSILIGTILATLSVLTIAFTQIWGLYIALMCAIGFSSGLIFPSVYAMAGGVWPEGGQKAFNLIYISQNIGVAVGTALGGIVAQYSFKYTFLVNGFTYILFTLLVFYGLDKGMDRQPRGVINPATEVGERIGFKFTRGFVSLLILCFGFMTLWITYVQWQTSISAFMRDAGYSLSSYSLIWTINGALILLFQPISLFITSRIIPVVKHQLLLGVGFFVLSFIVISQTQVYSSFVIAMIIITIGEIFIWPGVPATAERLAPEGKKGFYQGVVNTFSTAGRMMGPLIGGFLFDHYGIQIMFYVMVGFSLIGFVSFLLHDLEIKSIRSIRETLK